MKKYLIVIVLAFTLLVSCTTEVYMPMKVTGKCISSISGKCMLYIQMNNGEEVRTRYSEGYCAYEVGQEIK